MIRNLIYLDEPKMYSLSSQVFEGMTDYILQKSGESTENHESQKGEIWSGRILADVLATSKEYTEKRYLHDYSYSLFEEYLKEKEKIIEINEKEKKINLDTLSQYSFIKIKSKLTFYDMNKISDLFKDFNGLGEAITYLGMYQELEQNSSSHNNPKKKGFAENQNSNKKKKVLEEAKKKGLHYDQEFLNSLSSLIDYSFGNILEVHQHINQTTYSAILKEDFLREDKEILARKYSRQTEKELVVCGLITQSSQKFPALSHTEELNRIQEGDQMKELLMIFIDALTNIEHHLSGRLSHEIVIDPIAVYVEI